MSSDISPSKTVVLSNDTIPNAGGISKSATLRGKNSTTHWDREPPLI